MSADEFDRPSVRVSKLDAARRQLETAITLYFQHDDGDIVAIHTLACAAHEIIETLNRRDGGAATLRQGFETYIKPDTRDEFYSKLMAAKNFFKHADRDPDSEIKFSPSESELFMVDAALTYRRLTGGGLPPARMALFLLWSALTWAREWLSYEGLDPPGPLARKLAAMTRPEFYAQQLPIAQEAAVLFARPPGSDLPS
jgi:hypothetical protein